MSNTSLVVNLALNGQEAFTAAEAPTGATVASRTVQVTGSNVSATLDSTTTPKVEISPVIRRITISGTTTIDLTAAAGLSLPVAASRTIDATGKKLVAWSISCPITNAGVVNVAPGASNGYALFGSGNDIDISPGETVKGVINGVASGKPAVSASAKNIDITGTNNDVVLIELYFGT
jgi:hypothetical protein